MWIDAARGADRGIIEPHCPTLELRPRRAIQLHYHRVVPRDDVIRRAGETLDETVGIQHVAQVKRNRKGTVAGDVLVKVRAVRGQHDPAASCVHPHRLQTRGVPGCRMQRQPRRQLDHAVVQFDPSGEIEPHDADHLFGLIAVGEECILHVPTGGEIELALLQVKTRRRKAVKITDMVVVQVRDDHVFDRGCMHSKCIQSVDRRTQIAAAALHRHLGRKAGIDHEAAAGAPHQPGEIIHRHVGVVRIAADEMLRAPSATRCITQRIDLVFRQRLHGRMVAHLMPPPKSADGLLCTRVLP